MKKLSIFFILLIALFFLPGRTFAKDPALIIEKGDNQKVQVGQQIQVPLQVRATDPAGKIFKTEIQFKVLKGEGTLSHESVMTDDNGRAKTNFKAGYLPGEAIIQAKLTKAQNISKEFKIKITLDNPTKPAAPESMPPSPTLPSGDMTVPEPSGRAYITRKTGEKPAVIVGAAGNNQKVHPGSFAQKNLDVQVFDKDGNPMQGVAINFEVTEGKGNFSQRQALTNEWGIASVSFIAGGTEGPITIKASLAGNSELSTIFSLQSTREAPMVTEGSTFLPSGRIKPRGFYSREPVSISVVGGNYQRSDAGVRLPQPLVVYVTDADGNPAEATVQFTLLGGDATIVNRQVRTDARGLASTFIIANTKNPIRIVAEVEEKPGLATIAYANSTSSESSEGSLSPVIKSSVSTNKPGYPAAIAFYNIRSSNIENIEKTRVVPLEIGVTDFRNIPVSTTIKFSAIKGNISILNPVVQTNAEGRGTCYVDVGSSMGIFTIEAQSLENPDLKALFKSGPTIQTSPSSGEPAPVSTPAEGSSTPTPASTEIPPPSITAPPPAASSGKPAIVAVLRGTGQKGKAGERLPEPLEVLVTDEKGIPVAKATVVFIVFRGKATLDQGSIKTDSAGKVSTYVTLGKRSGEIEIAVRVKENSKLRTTVHLKAE